MKDKFKRFLINFFTKNIPLKIFSVLIGLVIWVLLSNSQDPVITKPINVPITYTNADVLLEKEGLVVIDRPETATIQVSYHQANASRVSPNLFTCTADVSDHTGGLLSSQRVHINVRQTGGSNVIVNWNYQRNDPNTTVVMDEYIEKQFKIELLAEDSLTEGLILEDSLSFSPAEITVGGPSGRFGSLASAKAVVNLQELSENGGGVIEKEVAIGLYDANDRLIPNTDGALTLSQSTAILNATISRRAMAYVRVSGVTGEPADGYRYLSCTVDPESIAVRGLKSSLADLTEIFIPDDVIDISGISESRIYTVDITPYLPEGISLEGSEPYVNVLVSVEAVTEKNVTIPAENIALKGTRSGLMYEFRTASVNLLVKGFQEDLDVLTLSSLAPSADVSQIGTGTHYVKVDVNRVPGYTYENADNLRVYITVSSTTPETDPTKPTESESPSESESPTPSEQEPETPSSSSEESREETPASESGGEENAGEP